ncbi:ROK family transcriptional regulator [Amycolatopsis thermophila]|uniref:NBD/HSP70 family sugar kinase n=1 Tax=Amycolatopsis thermophila TaxID=206084 RepID=A0ABU0F2G6_9PSEU|nr:ROK family transcriptional regulator [Amycolatopsis thermophila]MDQ0381265.1 putative NBD/HSP70 family sugar kinase [Amycolatopsis thermophila]
MATAKPSLDLLRTLTDEHVLRALMDHRRLTRAELAKITGISKPTVSESVRRLSEAGVLRDTGERTTGRGRVGSYYALAEDAGLALVASMAPEGVVAECVDGHGDVVARASRAVSRPATPAEVTAALRKTVTQVAKEARGPLVLSAVSAADPVDRRTGRLVHLPDAPFLIGELSPVDVLGPLVAGPVRVDNDVNWAARAEREAGAAAGLDDFAYLHLGAGLGCAVVSDGEVRRGACGLAGEIAHLVTEGPDGRAVAFTEVFEVLGLRQQGTAAIDVAALLEALAGDVLDALAAAIGGVLAALLALGDPGVVVLGGEWGSHPALIDAVERRLREKPRRVPLRPAEVVTEPALAGARSHALVELRSRLAAPPPGADR